MLSPKLGDVNDVDAAALLHSGRWSGWKVLMGARWCQQPEGLDIGSIAKVGSAGGFTSTKEASAANHQLMVLPIQEYW